MNGPIQVCEMHACLRQPMRLCRWAGMFPIEGLDMRNGSKLRFNLKSVYTIYHCAALLGQVLITSLSAYHFFTKDLNKHHMISLVFYLTNLTSAVFLFKLARHWPELIKQAAYIEHRVAGIHSDSYSSSKCTKIAYVVLILSLLEHIMSILYQVRLLMNCTQEFTLSLRLMEKYFTLMFPFIFNITSYSHWKAILFEVINVQSTFLWNFTDVMTMCASLYLTSYFKSLNKIIEEKENQKVVRWGEMRLYYSDLVKLVKIVDSKLCNLVLLSCFTNVFFICVQLFNLLNLKSPEIPDCHDLNYKSTEYYIYYAYSTVFLFVRATVTSLMAANVQIVAKQPYFTLMYVPRSDYTIEVQRFIRQIVYTAPALTGIFFDVTREMIPTVIGTIVKYELVLLQYNQKPYKATQ